MKIKKYLNSIKKIINNLLIKILSKLKISASEKNQPWRRNNDKSNNVKTRNIALRSENIMKPI
jgi:hypothetical protein